MAMRSLFDRLCKQLRALRVADCASVTSTFALSTIPLVSFIGAAVDYSNSNRVKAAMQAAADSTALMLSKEAASLTTSQIEARASDYFKALFTRKNVATPVVSVTYTTTGGSQVLLKATASVKTNFMGLMGFASLNVAVNSQAKWGNTRLRVALALDNTGSMDDDGKMSALRTATKNLLSQLKGAAVKDGDVYVSIIPFSKDVNVGRSHYQESWIDWTDWENVNGSCSSSWYDTKSECQSAGKTWTANSRSDWRGCVTDRGNSNGPNTGNYDTNVVAPTTAIQATLFAAEQYSSCPKSVMPLNYDWTAMNDKVDRLAPAGNTNQAIGLAHGWMSLVGGGPYPTPPAEEANYKYSKVIILLTDGLNTQNRWYNNQNSIDTREKMTCDNIKASGITLYTVQVNTGGDPTSTLLQQCASGSDKFFLLTSANQMVATFQQIGTALSNLRIAQ